MYGKEGSSEWKNENHLYSRIIVVGGGAGMNSSSRFDAGCGGGLKGENGMYNSVPIKGGGFGVGGSNTLKPSSGGRSGWYGGCAYNDYSGWGPGAAGGSGHSGNGYAKITPI